MGAGDAKKFSMRGLCAGKVQGGRHAQWGRAGLRLSRGQRTSVMGDRQG